MIPGFVWDVQNLELIEIGQFMGTFTLKGFGVETDLPQQTRSKWDTHHVGQPILTEHNIMNWFSGIVFPKYLKASALGGIALEIRFS